MANPHAIKKRLAGLISVLNKVAGGDLSQNIRLAKTKDEFTPLYVGLRRVIEAMRHQIVRTELINKRKSQFFTTAAHELRTPLGNMRWSLETILDDESANLSENAKIILYQAYDSSIRMTQLVNDLLTVSKLEEGYFVEGKKLIDICDVIRKTVALFSSDAKKKSVTLKLLIPKNKHCKRLMEPFFFSEAINNILSNAIKYSKMQGTVEIAVEKTRRTIKLRISDTGIGIPKNEQPNIFTKFFRATNAKKHTKQGTGLGLYIVREYIKKWGGRIWFVSKIHKGSTFFVEIPLQ